MNDIRYIDTSRLSIAYEEHGPATGLPVVLLHGFPYAPRAYDGVAPILAARERRVIVPHLRGFGATRFRDSTLIRSGEQAALGTDLIEMIVGLKLDRPIVAGYDWGGRAACVTAAIRPDLVSGLVTCGGYNLLPAPTEQPLPPEVEHVLWYQFYLQTARGRAMLESNRRGFCRLLWKLWSPEWSFDDDIFEQSAEALECPDFVEVVLHSYRHRAGLAAGDPELRTLADMLERQQPAIDVPTIALYGESGLRPADITRNRDRFLSHWEYRLIPGVGHNLPQEAPVAFARAVLELATG